MIALSIRSKLLTYTALIIALSVLGVGYLIDSSLLSYHRETAHKEIQASIVICITCKSFQILAPVDV